MQLHLKQFPSTASEKDGFILSRIASGCTLDELYKLCPWPSNEIDLKVQQWLQEGIVEQMDNRSVKKSRAVSLEAYKEILFQQLDRYNPEAPLDTLNLPNNASPDLILKRITEIKNQFKEGLFSNEDLGILLKPTQFVRKQIELTHIHLTDPVYQTTLDKIKQLEIKEQTLSEEQEKEIERLKKLSTTEQLSKAERFYQLGRDYEDKNNFIAAYQHFQIAAQLYPDRDLYAKALKNLEPKVKRIKLEKALPEARDYDVQGEWQRLLDIFNGVDITGTEEALVLAAKAIVEIRDRSRFDDAITYLERAKALGSKREMLYLVWAKLYSIQNRLPEAIRLLTDACKKFPNAIGLPRALEKIKDY